MILDSWWLGNNTLSDIDDMAECFPEVGKYICRCGLGLLGISMAIELHQKCKTRLKAGLAEALKHAKVKNGSFLDRHSLMGIWALEETLPSTGQQRKLLEEYISERPLFDFVCGYLSKEIYENEKYDGDALERNLCEIEGYQDLDAIAGSIIDNFDSLPWKYCFTFRINSELSNYFEDESVQITDDIRIIKFGDQLVADFPLRSGVDNRDQFLHGGLAVSLLGLGRAEWSENQVYIQVLVDGYMGKWTTTEPQAKAVDTLKAILGLLIATRAIENRKSYSATFPKSRYYIHKNNGGWEIDNSDELDHNISRAISDLRIDDLGGHLDTDDKKSHHVQVCLGAISKALRPGAFSDKFRLAGQWLFDSYCGQNELLSYIQTTVSLEILLGDKNLSDLVGLGVLLRNRCAYLIGTSHSRREEILSDFKDIYEIRSKIVHRGKSKLSSNDRRLFWKLQWMVGRVLQEEIKLAGKNN